ncbi:MAG TPA: hypothetical protein VII17_04140 [Steroidobacteraceae bacterium]
MSLLEVLSRLLSALFRHFVAYADLLCDEAGDAVRVLRRQLLGLVVVLVAGNVAILMGCLWVITAAWNGPYRMHAIAALCIGFVLIALGGVWYANTGTAPGEPRPFQRLREEWSEDLRELAAFEPSLAATEQSAASAVGELHAD